MYKFDFGKWENLGDFKAQDFICWNCGKEISSVKAFASYNSKFHKYSSTIFICPRCKAPLITDDEHKQILIPLPGKEIKKLPKDIEIVYSEIRKCMQAGCVNGAIMLMRKLIMHIAVEGGAEEGKSFVEYINYLCDNHFVPPRSRNKADSVRTLGNNANHKIENRTQEEAQNCFEFIELLLKVNYEFADEEEENGE